MTRRNGTAVAEPAAEPEVDFVVDEADLPSATDDDEA
jgi:hypothetical protein